MSKKPSQVPTPSDGAPIKKSSESVEKTENQPTKLNLENNPEQEMFEKVAIMANLTAAVQNSGLRATISDLPGGEKIYSLLVKAVHQEIQSIMGKSDKDTKDLSNNMQQMALAMSKFVSIMNTFNDMKLVGVISALNQKLKPLGDLNQPQQMFEQHQNHVDQGNGNEVSSNEQVYVAPGQRAPRNTGLGSF